MKIYIHALLLVLILLVSCTTQQPIEPEQQITEPGDETPVETTQPEETGEIIRVPNDIREILEKGKTISFEETKKRLIYR